jgi:ataxia telangiectasia mutated family protein
MCKFQPHSIDLLKMLIILCRDLLTDKSYHKIYEVLFKSVLLDKKSVLTAKKTTIAAASTRLKECGDAIRVVVKAGAPKLKSRTVDAVADHIIQVLPTTDGGYVELLADNYFKALSALFECPENVERLKPEVWFNIVDFCLRGINEYLGDPDGELSGLSRPFSGLGTGSSSSSMTRTNSRGQSKPNSRINQNVSDLFQTVLQLVSAPNAPLLERYVSITESTILFLQSQSSSVNQVHQTAFGILNTILRLTRMERTSFSQSVACKTIPIMSRVWQGKSLAKDEMLNHVRDEMFIFMFSIFLHVERGLKDEKNHEIGSDLEELLDALRADYTSRSERDQLQLDELELAYLEQRIQASTFHLDLFQLRPHATKAERNWALLLIIGILERLVSLGQQLRQSTGHDEIHEEDLHPVKRQRPTNALDRMVTPLRAIDEKSKTAELQILPFVLQECQLSASELVTLIAQLHQCTGDKRGNIASWALIAMAW